MPMKKIHVNIPEYDFECLEAVVDSGKYAHFSDAVRAYIRRGIEEDLVSCSN